MRIALQPSGGSARWCPLLIIASVLMGCTAETPPQAVVGSAKADHLTQCVAPRVFMRRNHMELIKHQRDATVHQGVRATQYSLVGCIDCHVQHDAAQQQIPVNAVGQFCANCHAYVGMRLDCFSCHAPAPTGPLPPALTVINTDATPQSAHL